MLPGAGVVDVSPDTRGIWAEALEPDFLMGRLLSEVVWDCALPELVDCLLIFAGAVTG